MFAALRSLLTPGSRSAPVQHASVVQPPTVHWPMPGASLPRALRGLRCPNCGSTEQKSLTLTIDVQLPDHPSKRLRVLRCPGCTAHIYDSQVPPDYAEPALNDRGRVPFYVEQGAGVGLITKPLAQLRAEPGSTYMEVGCGYGFGLDFAVNTRGWRGVGIDPAPLAALGRDALNLPIELRYLREDDEGRGTMDVVMGSEVIEHVTDPRAFVRTLRAMLKPGGTLILTTPNGDDIHPQTPPGALIPLLSPSLHLTIQNPVSLHRLLTEEGFAHVEVGTDSHSLLAFASDAPLRLETDPGALRRTYRAHLLHRAETTDATSDLFLGFAGRAFQESVNDGDMDSADRAWTLLLSAVQARFGLELDTMTTLPAEVASCSLERMAVLVPINLAGLLYGSCIRRLAAGHPRPALEDRFLLAAEAAGATRRALGELAMEDGQTEDIGWTARAEAALCAAAAGIPGVVERIRALPPAPTGAGPRRRVFILRALVGLVNAGHLDLARMLAAEEELWDAPFTRSAGVLPDVERDALFVLASLDVVQGDGAETQARARSWLARVRAMAEPGSGLAWDTLRRETQSLDIEDEADQAAELVRGMLARSGLPASALPPDLAARLQDGSTDLAVWEAKADAALHAAAEGESRVARSLHRMPLPPGPDAAGRRRTLVERGLARLVNGGHYASAAALAGLEGIWDTLPSPGTESGRDALFCLAVLALRLHGQEVDPGDRAMDLSDVRDWFARVRAAVPPGSGLGWAALRGELNALDGLGWAEEASRLLTEAGRMPGPAPDDIAARVSGQNGGVA